MGCCCWIFDGLMQSGGGGGGGTYTHPNHTGEVTSITDGVQTVDPTAISNKDLVTVAATDHVLIGDASDSDALKKVTAQDIADLSGDSATHGLKGEIQYAGIGGLHDSDPALWYDPVKQTLIVGDDDIGTTSGLALYLNKDLNGYVQADISNFNAGGNASADWVCSNDLSTGDVGYFADFGINSSTYSSPFYAIHEPNSAYIFNASGDFTVGTEAESGGDLILHTGGFDADNVRVRFEDAASEFDAIANFTSVVQLWNETTANRPTVPAHGMLRYNTTTDQIEGYANSTWVDLGAAGSSYTHPNHSGEVTSVADGVQTVDPTAITNKSLVDAATGDHILIADASDSGNLKKVTAQTIADLAAGSTTNDINYAYGTGNSSGFIMASTSFAVNRTFRFGGTTALGTPSAITIIAFNNNTSSDAKVYDLTNSLEICTVNFTNGSFAIIDMGTLSNLPTGEAIWELQTQHTGGGTGGDLASLTIEFQGGDMITDYHIRVVCEEATEHYARLIQTETINESIVCPTHPLESVRDFVIENDTPTVPTATASALQITTNVGTAIVDDLHDVTADGTDTTYVLMSVVRVDATDALEVVAFEKTTGEYGSIPAGRTLEQDINEFYVVANGTDLVEV